MGLLVIDGQDLRLRLPARQKVLGFHGDVVVPLTAIRSVRATEKPWMELRGRRMAGTAMRGVAAIGTWIHGAGPSYDFCVLRGDQPAVAIDVATGRFSRLLVGVPAGVDPQAEAARIAAAAGIAPG